MEDNHSERLYTLEELLIRVARNGSNLYGYFIRRRRGILSEAVARHYGVPAVIDNMPEWMVERGKVAPESVEDWRALFEAIERGEKSGFARVSISAADGSLGRYWLRFNGISDDQGAPFFAMVSFEDVSAEYEASRQREELRLQAEELRLSLSRMGKIINYYDIPTGTLTVPPAQVNLREFPNVIHHFPESFIAGAPEDFPPAALAALQGFYDRIRGGEPSGACEYRCVAADGRESWEHLEFASIFDREGRPLRAVVTVEDVTDRRLQTEENQRLRENEDLLRMITQHSDRIVCHYDVKTEMARKWDQRTCERCQLPHLCEMSARSVLECGDILPESVEGLRGVFRDIRAGKPNGAIKMRVRVKAGERRWFDLRYSTIFDGEGAPVSALISHKDITEQYEHELAYRRYVQSVEFEKEKHLLFIESDLTADRIDALDGQMLPPAYREVECSHSEFGRQMLDRLILYEKGRAAADYFSCENLLGLYAQGERQLKSEWKVRFQDGSAHWLDTEIALLTDPYSGHVKAFFRMLDITGEKEAQLDIRRRSERDGMTGLYNRATAEERIRAMLAGGEDPGILILLDLDDLKDINDTFGHKEGDRAILGIAETLKSHFRESDVIGRVGGDEFIIYLPGAWESSDAIVVSIAALLRKLAGIPIGAGDERRIHCSVGCAVQTGAASAYEDLYKQADTALYHVKRNGKNSFAFYAPEMDRADYQFKAEKLFSLRSAKKFESTELQHLLGAIATFYQLVLSVNLSTNDYYVMEEVRDGVFSKVPIFGILDDFVRITVGHVHPGDVSGFMEQLSRGALLQAYERGERSIRCSFRFQRRGEYLWTEATVIFYTNENGDVCDFTLVRWANERAYELERLWLQKVLELAVLSSFEYICLIDADSGKYFLYGDESNTHGVPPRGSFDEVTRKIRDHFIAPEEREAYYEAANIDHVVARMQAGEESYTYRYNMPDGARQAAFYWFEPTHTQLLMTVQRIERTGG